MLRLYYAKDIDSESFLESVFDSEHVQDRTIICGENGKPYLKSGEFFFNISDCDGQLVCAVSDKEIGIDIQKICEKPRVARKICQPQELEQIKTPEDFTRIWTLKEAFVKANGAGLGYGLQNVDTTSLKQAKSWRYGDFYISICYNKD